MAVTTAPYDINTTRPLSKMWGALLGATLSLHKILPHPYTHATHAVWYLLRSELETTPTVQFGDQRIARESRWYNWAALACVSCATALPVPNMLDYTWIPFLVFCGNGYAQPAGTLVVQGAFFAGYAHVRPEAMLASVVCLWKHVHTTRRALWCAAAAHAVLACFEPPGDPMLLFMSVVTAECKYQMSQAPCRHVFAFWGVSLLAMTYELHYAVWAVPTLLSLGRWAHQWEYTDQVSLWGCLFISSISLFQYFL